ncbi:MAG TPA: alpha/beta fold hydrolase [Candidatus Acidoferrales bacterium]|nr:alpha/beta fold hydrolase [Candidatus Acidoferrales bacterium]
MTYSEALSAFERLEDHRDDTVAPASRSLLLSHGEPRERAVVLFHGLTSSPPQFDAFARALHARGENVIVPRLPRHGDRDRLSNALRDFSMDEVLSVAESSLEIARALGRRVTVAGFSVGGLLTAWLAQHHRFEHAVAISPFLGIMGIPHEVTPLVARTLRRLPNRFVYWHPIKRERLLPVHGYPRIATRAVAASLELAQQLLLDAAQTAPRTPRITLALNAREAAVNNNAARRLADLWEAHGVSVERRRLRGLPPSHDIVEPLRHPKIAAKALALLLPVFE